MKPGHITGATRSLGAPEGWDTDVLGPCGTLTIRDDTIDGVSQMTSAWYPTNDELVRIAAGAPVMLTIVGTAHPAVYVYTGIAEPLPDVPPPKGYQMLPLGVLCRCPKMWKHGDRYYCCEASREKQR